MSDTTRTAKERILLFLSALVVITVSPFIVLRYLDDNIPLALWNLFLSGTMGVLFVYVWRTHKVTAAGLCLSLAFFSGSIITVYLKGAEQIYWAYPAFVGPFYMMNPLGALALSIVAWLAIMPVLLAAFDSAMLAVIHVSLIMNVIFAFVFSAMTRNQHKELTLLSRTDPLTGAWNRRVMADRMARVLAIFRRSKLPVSILLLDLDHFKQVNDEHGHYVGDMILVRLTKILTDNIRISDSLYRYGGEEFVIIAENTDIESASIFAEKLRTIIELSNMVDEVNVSISIGIAQLNADEATQDWLERADNALLQAKREGRNQVCLAGS